MPEPEPGGEDEPVEGADPVGETTEDPEPSGDEVTEPEDVDPVE